MKKRFDVVGIGSCTVDFLGIVPSFPKPDTKNKMLTFIQQGGGPVATALVALARLGAKVSYVGKLGEDLFSQFALNEFLAEGVDTSAVIREKGAGPYLAFIIVDKETGERTIWWTDQMVSFLKEEELSKKTIASARILHLDEYNHLATAVAAATFAKEAGVPVVLDAESPWKRDLLSLIELTDYLIVPEEFALGFSKKEDIERSAIFLLKHGPKTVVVTQGATGSLIKTEEKTFFQPAFQVPVVDTTGCGDVFHGGFIYGLLKGWPVEIAAEFASAVAGLKCGKLGGRAGCPSFLQVKDFLLARGSERIRPFLI